jgi:hypothetical protein
MVGFVSERDDGPWLTLVEDDGAGGVVRGSRRLSDEQVGWLRRQGDLR